MSHDSPFSIEQRLTLVFISGLLSGVAFMVLVVKLLMPLIRRNEKQQKKKMSVRYVRRETQWPNFTWVRVESPLLKPSERGKK